MSANSAWNVLNFRMNLIEAFDAEGYSTVVAAPNHSDSALLEERGVRFIHIPMRANGTSPIEDARLLLAYRSLMRRIRPVAYLGFTAKPNVYGSIAAAGLGVPVINNVTGLGTAFIASRGLERLLSSLYRFAFRRSDTVFFHNSDDLELFANSQIIRPGQGVVIPGSGVNLGRFRPLPLPGGADDPTFLFVGRLIDEKGVREFAEATALVKRCFPHARFRIVGPTHQGRRGIPGAELESWLSEGRVEYLGTCSDIRPHLGAADCVVLPSYREGLPRVLLEAAAMGRPTVASDVPGCRHAVVEGKTGFLCTPRSGAALAEVLIRFARLSPSHRAEIGLQGRRYIEEHFDEERVTLAYLSALRRICARAQTG